MSTAVFFLHLSIVHRNHFPESKGSSCQGYFVPLDQTAQKWSPLNINNDCMNSVHDELSFTISSINFSYCNAYICTCTLMLHLPKTVQHCESLRASVSQSQAKIQQYTLFLCHTSTSACVICFIIQAHLQGHSALSLYAVCLVIIALALHTFFCTLLLFTVTVLALHKTLHIYKRHSYSIALLPLDFTALAAQKVLSRSLHFHHRSSSNNCHCNKTQ